MSYNSFNPYRSEVENTWVTHRGQEIARERCLSSGQGQWEAIQELNRLKEAGAPPPWIGKVSPITKNKNSDDMCGAYALNALPKEIRQYFPSDWGWKYPGEMVPMSKIGPSSKTAGHPSTQRLVVCNTDDGIVFDTMRWRYENKWMREKKIKIPINARSETMFTNGLFKFSARSNRCLVIADGFYEPKGPKGTKREQYLFTFDDHKPFAMGGLWTKYRADDDEFDGFVICTTEPSPEVAPIHGRMPVTLNDEDSFNTWLLGGDAEVKDLSMSHPLGLTGSLVPQ